MHLAAEQGHQCIGPVHPKKGALEYSRFTQVYKSIRDNGYKRSNADDADLKGRVLRSGGKSVIIITTGAHRVVALSTLGYSSAPVRIQRTAIYREDVDIWPNVSNGLFTRNEALATFDRVFAGEWPAAIGYGPDDDVCMKSLK